MTAPPLKAKEKAADSPFFAAWAVLMLLLTATFIPITPAMQLKTAPTTNPSAVTQLNAKYKMMAISIPIIPMTEYCLFM